MAEQIEVSRCKCCHCEDLHKRASEEDGTARNFTFLSHTFNYNFPLLENPHSAQEMAKDLGAVVYFFENIVSSGNKSRSVAHTRTLVRFVTYYHINVGYPTVEVSVPLPLWDICSMLDYISEDNLESVITDNVLASNFLRKVALMFMYVHDACLDDQLVAEAEWSRQKISRFLTFLVSVPIFASKVVEVFSSKDFWPQIGPLAILNKWAHSRKLLCIDSASLMCNLTRIDGFVNLLDDKSNFMTHMTDTFTDYCRTILQSDELGGLVLNLLVNLAHLDHFSQFILQWGNGNFVKDVLFHLISKGGLPPAMEIALWCFVKNLSMRTGGRELIMADIDSYLGQLLYPIAGGEEIAEEEMDKLPLEVQFLPETKRRVESKIIRECILDILFQLCRYKNDRVMLRDANVYQILKHYHLAETDKYLLEKTEDLVNILIRYEGDEIAVDDLLEGLSVKDNKNSVEDENETAKARRMEDVD